MLFLVHFMLFKLSSYELCIVIITMPLVFLQNDTHVNDGMVCYTYVALQRLLLILNSYILPPVLSLFQSIFIAHTVYGLKINLILECSQ